MSNSSLPIPVGAYIGQPENSNTANEAAFEAEYQSFAKLLGSAPQFLDYFLNENERVSAWAGNALRWSRLIGQFGGRVKLGSGCRQAASLSVTPAPYASSGVRPPNVEWGRRVL